MTTSDGPHSREENTPPTTNGARGFARVRFRAKPAYLTLERERQPSRRYIPIAWYPESTYSVVPVTFRASSDRR